MVSIDASFHSLRDLQPKRLDFRSQRARDGVEFVVCELGLFLRDASNDHDGLLCKI